MGNPLGGPKTMISAGQLRTGAKLSITRLILGELPRELLTTKRHARRYRRLLEAACAERHGGVNVRQAHIIDAATGYELHATICRWLLNNRWDKMNPKDVLTCSETMAKAKMKRNGCLDQLGIDPPDADGTITATYTQILAEDPGSDLEPSH